MGYDMHKTNNILFRLSLCLSLCGGVLLIAQLMNPCVLELTARITVAAGCIALIVSTAFRSSSQVPAYTAFGKSSIKDTETGITFDDIAANAEAKQSLESLVDYLRKPEKYSGFGARMPRGVLLYGPPGTGKTLLARALAGEAGVPFFALSGSDFVQMYVGVGAGRVRELFSNARKAGKCVIFIDEIDALGKRRNDAASEERDQTLNALLSEMSGFRASEGIIVLAATNRIETLDPALIRPGRFDRHIEVGLPGLNERLEILKLHSRNKPLSPDIDLHRLAHDTCAFSGAALEALLNEAAIIAVQRQSDTIESDDINCAYYKTVAGADGVAASDPEERCTIALHEAGHAVVFKRLMHGSRLKRISILSAGRGAAGYNLTIPQERSLIKKQDMENQIAVLLAGRAAELLINGDDALTSGASGDLSRAAEITVSMIMDLGMGDEPAVSVRALSAACGIGRSVDELCRTKLDELFKKAYSILESDAELLMQITSELLSNETLEENRIDALFDQHKSL